jgi:CRISPR associated protein Cas1
LPSPIARESRCNRATQSSAITTPSDLDHSFRESSAQPWHCNEALEISQIQRRCHTAIDWQGNVQTVMANNCYAANPYRIAWQSETRSDPKRRMAFCTDLITRKIDGCIKTLEKIIPRSAAWEQAMKRPYADITRLACDPPRDIVALRALEAGSAAAYFGGKYRCNGKGPISVQFQIVGSELAHEHRSSI